MSSHAQGPWFFHISRRVRERYGVEEALFSFSGNVVLADFGAARRLAHQINEVRDAATHPERAVRASDLNAMGLIDETLHLLVAQYRAAVRPALFADALATLTVSHGEAEIERLLEVFVDEFPPPTVARGEQTAVEYLAGATGGVAHREVALEELLLLALANQNPAFAPFAELFDDQRLEQETCYQPAVQSLTEFLGGQPEDPEIGLTLVALLRAPITAAPDSLEGQLAFLRDRFGARLGSALRRLLGSLDFLAEESKPFFGFGPGPVEVPVYPSWADRSSEPEPEAYSADLDWMPRVVLIAKNVHVWLHQLSESYGRPIRALDEIPDSELDLLARRGFSAIWLIGVWERSRASARIKRMMGDHEAVASAYSLEDYRVADDLGGAAAYDDLKARAWQRGLRLATDMVPNHVGIDSRWVVQHPDWFVQRRDPPFPGYSFNGPDLCDDHRVGVYLEDHYWNRSDASVVFKRVDHWTGDVRYLYHGNDGTSMPWNDTAQLDYLNPEVREAVIQTILHVARMSPIIRFDAAMTLTKRHVHRLWFPEPGSGGDIPSRAEFGMTRDEFDRAMPQEFWREVVDRVAREAPDTLLLAEAFWMLEGYFVRSLGMHRVYNSAFMNMLRDERNSEYRQLIKSTLEYDPQILKRYVNFMSNPDERTAVDQFGGEDKYFGVATVMATMPGLPMFGHGQLEGFAEKYGMEFQRARWHETPNRWLIDRHERQLCPLLHRRRLFAEVDDFLLYDFEHDDGGVDENVFAYCNRFRGERSLVVFNNRYGDTRGRLRRSTAVAVGRGDERRLEQRSLAEGLGLEGGSEHFVMARDAASGLELLRPSRELVEHGLWLELGAYRLHVFLDIKELADSDGRLRRLAERLAGRGVPSLSEAMRELELEPVLAPLAVVLEAGRLRELLRPRAGEVAAERERRLDGFEEGGFAVARAVVAQLSPEVTASESLAVAAAAAGRLRGRLAAVLELRPRSADDPSVVAPERLELLAAWTLTELIGEAASAVRTFAGRGWLDELMVATVAGRVLEALWRDGDEVPRGLQTVRALTLLPELLEVVAAPDAVVDLGEELLGDPESRAAARIHDWDGFDWIHRESLDELLELLALAARVELTSTPRAAGEPPQDVDAILKVLESELDRLRTAAVTAGFRVDRMRDLLSRGRPVGSDPSRDADKLRS